MSRAYICDFFALTLRGDIFYFFAGIRTYGNLYTRDVTAKTIAEENVAKNSTRTGLSGRASLALFYARERCDISEKRPGLYATSAFIIID